MHSEPGDPPVHSEPDDPLVVVSLSSIRERFSPESLPESVDTTDLDPLFALPLPNEGEPLLLQANEVELPLMEELVDNEEMKDDSKGIALKPYAHNGNYFVIFIVRLYAISVSLYFCIATVTVYMTSCVLILRPQTYCC